MAEMEYKTVIAPITPRKYKGVKNVDERFARTIADAMNEAAAGGWFFERVEVLAMEVKRGAFRGTSLEHRNVMVFSREKKMQQAARVEPTTMSADARHEPSL